MASIRRFVPKADSCTAAKFSLDHFVGPRLEKPRHLEPESLRSLEIDDQLELRRLLHRQISRLRAIENSIYILGRAAKMIIPVEAVGYQAAGCYGLGKPID